MVNYTDIPSKVTTAEIRAAVGSSGDLPVEGEAGGQIVYIQDEVKHVFWNQADEVWQDLVASGSDVYTNEDAQDAVGGIIAASDTIELAYDDSTPSITATIKLADASISSNSSGIYVPNDHTHANKTELDLINQDLSTGSTSAVFNYVSISTGNWDDLIPTDPQDAAGQAAPDLVAIPGYTNMTGFGFDGGNTTESRCYTFELPHDYKTGTELHPHIHWCGSNSNAGNVIWHFDYAIFPADSGTTEGLALGTVSTPATANPGLGANGRAIMTITEASAVINGTGRKLGDTIRVRVYRTPTATGDTYTGDAILIQPGIHYLRDAFGSREEYVK